MAHFAQIDDNNIVTNVIVVANSECLDSNGNESEEVGINFCTNLLGGRWVQTSYNNKIRRYFAGIGYYYDQTRDAFIPPKPFLSWVFNEETYEWDPPIPRPTNTLHYWDESEKNWKPVI